MGWWDDFFFHVALYVKYHNFLRLLKPGPVPSFSQCGSHYQEGQAAHIWHRHLVIREDLTVSDVGRSSFSTSWIPRWESLKKSPHPIFRTKSNLFANFCSPEKEAFARISFGLVGPVLPVSSSKHASAADAKLCLTRRMPSKFLGSSSKTGPGAVEEVRFYGCPSPRVICDALAMNSMDTHALLETALAHQILVAANFCMASPSRCYHNENCTHAGFLRILW